MLREAASPSSTTTHPKRPQKQIDAQEEEEEEGRRNGTKGANSLSLFCLDWPQSDRIMRRRIRAAVVFVLLLFISVAYLYLQFIRYPFSSDTGVVRFRHEVHLGEEQSLVTETYRSPPLLRQDLVTDAVLLPEWEVLLLIRKPDLESGYRCIFRNGAVSAARREGTLSFSNRTAVRCRMPRSVRRLRPLRQPALTRENRSDVSRDDRPELFRWNFLVYEALPTVSDVILFAKGLNSRQGVNFPVEELRCVFGDESKPETYTRVVSSSQEVFRCDRPRLTVSREVKVSLDMGGRIVPSVAYYRSVSAMDPVHRRHELCASTMIFNVGKFVKEWIVYHSSLGVDRFILYDNGSEDNTGKLIDDELSDRFNVTRILWPWPKTQEAGFSHAAASAMSSSCKWTMFLDVDEFFVSSSWSNLTSPENALRSMVDGLAADGTGIGQIQAKCLEFGPSGQKAHPSRGVIQGYDCRRRAEQRHKSIVRWDAVASSLLNVVHHFELGDGWSTRVLDRGEGWINHYKYQAWTEFRTKFRRRVSAYVVDWRQTKNLGSQDRTPGLGYEPVEPAGWPSRFCEVRDTRLKQLTSRWLGSVSPQGRLTMAWEER